MAEKKLLAWQDNINVRRNLIFIFMAVMTLVIFYVLLSLMDIQKIAGALLSISMEYLLVLILLEAVIVLLMARRYQTILGHMGSKLPYVRCLCVNMATYTLIPVTPSISGNFIKVLYLRKDSPVTTVAGSVVAERLFDMAALIGLVLLGLAFNFNALLFAIIIAIIVAAALAAFVASRMSGRFQRRIFRMLDESAQVIIGLFHDPRALSSIVFYSLLVWGLALVQIYFFFLAVGASVPFLSVIFRMPVAMLIGQIPVTIGGMGTRDGAMLGLFGGAVGLELIIAAGLLFSAFRYWLPAAVGIPFMLLENGRAIKRSGK